jgi:subtilase family serine protease
MHGRRARKIVLATTFSATALAAAALTAPAASSAAPTVTEWVAKPVCATARPGHASCDAMRLVAIQVPAATAGADRERAAAVLPGFATGPGGGYTPGDIAKAYGVNPGAATSQVVAIVDAFADPDVLSELNTFNDQYGLQPETTTSFKEVNQNGLATPLPTADAGWAAEIALDVQSVRGLCHKCKIVLVEANSNSFDDLATAVNTAATTMNATIISNSYGGNESGSGFTPTDAAKYDHPGVAILASTGDDGWYGWDKINPTHSGTGQQMSQVPASLNTVVGVAGTSLYLNSDATRAGETVWNSNGPHDYDGWSLHDTGASGGGCSVLFNAQNWQKNVAGYGTLGCATNRRSSTDIAAIADPFTGYDIYLSYNQGTPKWFTYGGTSLASPVIAALWALAGGPGGVNYPALSLYGHFKSDTTKHLYDVTLGGTASCNTSTLASCANWWTGSNTGNPNLAGFGLLDCAWNPSSPDPATPRANRYQCYAQKGYDGVSGVGTPMGTTPFTPMSPTAVIKAPATVTHGHSATFGTTGTRDPFPGGTIVTYKWTWGDGHTTTTSSASASHTYASAGQRTVKLTVTDNYGRSGSKKLTITVH